MTKIILWSSLIIIALSATYYFFIPKTLHNKSILPIPGKPKVQIKETHTIGWWSKQHALTLRNFEVLVMDSQLNLFNNKSLVLYNLTGSLSYDKGWRPYVKEIHISERYTYTDNNSKEAIIEITPVIDVSKDKNYNGELLAFDITNEKIITSFHWGKNRVKFKCYNTTHTVVLEQRK